MMSSLRTMLVFAICMLAALVCDAGELLYNGIRLPDAWPPEGATNYEPMHVPYLAAPPAVIPIDVGRQLFVDDFLVQQTTLKRTFHTAEYYAQNPVLKPDRPWETCTEDPTAMVFSDGVWYDPQDRLFKIWYMGGYLRTTCYATSRDGLAWDKPALDVRPGTNIVWEDASRTRCRDSAVEWLDQQAKDPARRYKMFVVHKGKKGWEGLIYGSADGVHWGEPLVNMGRLTGDRSTIFYNPFRKVWVFSLRAKGLIDPRWRRYWESPDLVAGAREAVAKAVLWTSADKNDPPRIAATAQPQLYNLDATPYESLMLGLFTIWPGQPADRAKPNYVCLGFSRDGFHWDRPDHRPFANVSERFGDWNWGNVQSAGGGCLVVGDRLYFYVSGRAGVKGSPRSGVCTTGLAFLRRDGFASMDAQAEGALTTRPVQFKGKHLFVNVAAPNGELRVEILDAKGQTLAPFSHDRCVPVQNTDATRQEITWQGVDDLSTLSGQPVRFRFHLRKGQLYAFWMSPDRSGASGGYVAAGGPGFTGPRDTVGAAGGGQTTGD